MNNFDYGDIYLGVDLGSTSIKSMAIDDTGKIVWSNIQSTNPKNLILINEFDFYGFFNNKLRSICTTGYGRKNLKAAKYSSTEILCQAKGIAHLFEGTGTIIDVGGQDTKIINLMKNKVTDFYMNDKCASGTGRFIDKAAGILGCSLEEMANLEIREESTKPISSTCAVFAETEIISLISENWSVAKIADSLYYSLAIRLANTAQVFGFNENVVFTGGLAKHKRLLYWLEKVMKCKVVVPQIDSQTTAALGAALMAKELIKKEDVK